MAVVNILTIPDKTLDKKSERVTKIDSEVKEIVQNLLDTVVAERDPMGAGLAAPQIGFNKRICVVREFYVEFKNGKEEEKATEHILINPEITVDSNKTTLDWEGCLSVPDTYGLVKRFKKIKVKALNENGESIKFSATGLFARTIQHEIDHLDGILFTKKVTGKFYTEEELDKLYSIDTSKLG